MEAKINEAKHFTVALDVQIVLIINELMKLSISQQPKTS